MQKTLKRLKRTCAEKHRREIRTIWPMKTRVSMFRWTAASTSSTRRTIDFDFRTPPVVWAGLVCVFLDSVAYDVYDGHKVEYFSDCSRYLNTGSKSRSERISSRMAVSTGRPDENASSCCNDRRTTRLIDRLDCGRVASIFERCSRMSLAGKHPTRRDNYRRFQSRATIDPSISCPSEYEEYRSASVKVAESEPRKENNKDVRHRRWERSLTFFSLSVRSRILLVQYSRTRSTLVVFTQPPSVPAMDKVCSFNVSYMSITSFLLWREIVLSLRNGIMSHGHHCIADEWCLAEMPFRLENHGQCYRQNNLLDEILVSKMTSPRTPHTTVWSSERLLSSRNDWMLQVERCRDASDLSVRSRMSCCQGACLSKTESRDRPCMNNLSWLTAETSNKKILMMFCFVSSVDANIDWHVLLETSTSFSTLQIDANYSGLIVGSLFKVDHCDRSIV